VFVVRRSKVEDVPTLVKLARMVHFINLPADQDVIMAKVLHSRNSFIRAGGGEASTRTRHRSGEMAGLGSALADTDVFMFTLEDTETGACLGTSQVVSHMGSPGNPNVSFRLSERRFYSKTLQTGSTQTVARLYLDESGPTELGGLIVQPSFRRHKLRLGRFLSLVRFHFIGLHRDVFADRLVAEMMAPITPDGRNLLWEYLGRRFINLSYTEADRFCQVSREFITALLPREDIYVTLLPPEARAVLGQVGQETVPARLMLERLGFEYRGFVDPFDGGPHLHANVDDVSLVRDSAWRLLGDPAPASECKLRGFVSVLDTDGDFRAVECDFKEAGRDRIALPRKWLKLLGADPGDRVGVTPLAAPGAPASTPRAARRKGSTKKGRAAS
jgi:arginine N-succinyltransferase